MVATVALGFYLARGTTRRINRLANAINQLATGNLDVRVPVTGSDELTDLARVFNRMLGEVQQSRARIGVPAANRRVARNGAAPGPRNQKSAHTDSARCSGVPQEICRRGHQVPRASRHDARDCRGRRLGRWRRLVGNFSSFRPAAPRGTSRGEPSRIFGESAPSSSGTLGAEPTEGTDDVVIAHVTWAFAGSCPTIRRSSLSIVKCCGGSS